METATWVAAAGTIVLALATCGLVWATRQLGVTTAGLRDATKDLVNEEVQRRTDARWARVRDVLTKRDSTVPLVIAWLEHRESDREQFLFVASLDPRTHMEVELYIRGYHGRGAWDTQNIHVMTIAHLGFGQMEWYATRSMDHLFVKWQYQDIVPIVVLNVDGQRWTQGIDGVMSKG